MAYTPVKNQTPATSGDTFVNYVAAILTAGGFQRWYTDGTTPTVSGSPTTNGISNTTWTNNNYTGCSVELPDGRQYTLQRSNAGNTSRTWRILYSKAAGFRDGWITFVAKASLTDGQTIIMTDGDGNTETFEWDVAGNGVTGGRIQVNVSTDTTADQCAARFVTALGTSTLNLTAITTSTPTIYFQKTNRTGIMTITVSGGITAFAPSATRLPVAYADQKIVWGGGTDTTPTFTDLLPAAGTYKQNASVNGSAPYHHWMVLSTSATGVITAHLFLDRVEDAPVGEEDDVVWSVATTSPCNVISLAREYATGTNAWLGTSTAAGWGSVTANYWLCRISGPSNQQVVPLNEAIDPFTSQDTPEVLYWLRRPGSLAGNPGPYGRKGSSTMIKWNGLVRPIGNIVSVDATGDHFCADSVSLAGWDNTAVTP